MKNLVISIILLLLISCDDETNEKKLFFVGGDDFVFIDSTIKQDDFSVILYQYDVTQRNLIEGFNDLDISFYDFKSRDYTTNVNYDLKVYKIDGDTVFAPYYADQNFNNLDLASCPIYFTEGSNGKDWMMEVSGRLNGRDFSTEFRFNDVEVGIFQRDFEINGESYLFNFIEPFVPNIGVGDVEFSIHKIVGDKFEAANNFTSEINLFNENVTNPPGIINPEFADDIPGHYNGKINLTESGEWILEIKLYLNGEEAFTFEQGIFVKIDN